MKVTRRDLEVFSKDMGDGDSIKMPIKVPVKVKRVKVETGIPAWWLGGVLGCLAAIGSKI